MKKMSLKKITIPILVVSALAVYTAPALAWSSVRASATVTFSNFSTYYKATGTGKVSSSGSNTGNQVLENFSVFTRDGEVIDHDETRDDESPVELTFRSDKEGDSLTWGISVYGYLYEDGYEIDFDDDYDSETHPGI